MTLTVYSPWSRRIISALFDCPRSPALALTRMLPGWGSQCTTPCWKIISLYSLPNLCDTYKTTTNKQKKQQTISMHVGSAQDGAVWTKWLILNLWTVKIEYLAEVVIPWTAFSLQPGLSYFCPTSDIPGSLACDQLSILLPTQCDSLSNYTQDINSEPRTKQAKEWRSCSPSVQQV